MNNRSFVIVLASGTGVRFGNAVPKQFTRIGGRMIFEHTLAACDCGLFDEIILVISGEYMDEVRKAVDVGGYSTPVRVVKGGLSRKESCKCGVAAICSEEANVVIHNGVQPFVTRDYFKRCLAGLDDYQAVTSGVPCIYTILKIDGNRNVVDVPDRAHLYNDMGVECFKLSLLRRLFREYDDDVSTDIIGMVLRSGFAKVHVVEGNPRNIKITRQDDLAIAELFLGEVKDGDD